MTEAALRLLAMRRKRPAMRVAAAEAAADETAAALARYRDNDQIARLIGRERFLQGLDARRRRLAEANLAVADARARDWLHDLPPVDEARRALPTMTPAAQRELFCKIIDTVFVAPGRRSARERVTICPAGTGPRQLPRQGDRGTINRPLTPRRAWLNPPGSDVSGGRRRQA